MKLAAEADVGGYVGQPEEDWGACKMVTKRLSFLRDISCRLSRNNQIR